MRIKMDKLPYAWVELNDRVIIARVRGEATEELLAEVQAKVLLLMEDTRVRRILYDTLEMNPPTVELTLVQQQYSERIHALGVRVAILVPTTRIAYLARIAFGQGDHRVFYNDIAGALQWLMEDGSA